MVHAIVNSPLSQKNVLFHKNRPPTIGANHLFSAEDDDRMVTASDIYLHNYTYETEAQKKRK